MSVKYFSITKAIEFAVSSQASELQLESGLVPSLRYQDRIMALPQPVTHQELSDWIEGVLGASNLSKLKLHKALTCDHQFFGQTCKVKVYFSSTGLKVLWLGLQRLSSPIDHLNLHPVFSTISQMDKGLVLICGEAKTGKSSTLAGISQDLRSKGRKKAISISGFQTTYREDHGIVVKQVTNQKSQAVSIYEALGENPDILVIDELQDTDATKVALHAAETNKLVLSSVQSKGPVDALSQFSSTNQSSLQVSFAEVASSLKMLVHQKLTYLSRHDISVPVCEVLLKPWPKVERANQAATARELYQQWQINSGNGSISFKNYLRWLNNKQHFNLFDDFSLSHDKSLSSRMNRQHTQLATKRSDTMPTVSEISQKIKQTSYRDYLLAHLPIL